VFIHVILHAALLRLGLGCDHYFSFCIFNHALFNSAGFNRFVILLWTRQLVKR
jgi:hypothetical protein